MLARPLLALLLVATALAPAAVAEAILLDGRGELQRSLVRTERAATVEFWAGVQVDEDRPAYLKVLANDGNPVYRNGTAGGAGWWTEVGLLEAGAPRIIGATNGTALIELGVFRANETHTVWLRVHAPAGALARSADLRLNYVVAVRAPLNEQSSGGTLNPSILLQPHIVVESGASAEASGQGVPAWVLPAVGVAGVAVGAAVMVVAHRRKARPPHVEEAEPPGAP